MKKLLFLLLLSPLSFAEESRMTPLEDLTCAKETRMIPLLDLIQDDDWISNQKTQLYIMQRCLS